MVSLIHCQPLVHLWTVQEACEMYHVLVRGYSGMVLLHTVVLDHLLQPFVETLRAQPVTPLALHLLFSLGESISNYLQIYQT